MTAWDNWIDEHFNQFRAYMLGLVLGLVIGFCVGMAVAG